MTHVTANQFRDNLDTTLDRVIRDGERVVLRRNRKNVAVIIPIEDLAALEEIEDREDLEDARAIRKEIEREGTVPWETVKKNLGL